MTDHHDSNHNDTNAGEEHPNTTPRAGHDGHDTGSNAGDDLDWAAFAAEHANDLQDVERSRNARRFEKHAQRKEKEALLSDMDASVRTRLQQAWQGDGGDSYQQMAARWNNAALEVRTALMQLGQSTGTAGEGMGQTNKANAARFAFG